MRYHESFIEKITGRSFFQIGAYDIWFGNYTDGKWHITLGCFHNPIILLFLRLWFHAILRQPTSSEKSTKRLAWILEHTPADPNEHK